MINNKKYEFTLLTPFFFSADSILPIFLWILSDYTKLFPWTFSFSAIFCLDNIFSVSLTAINKMNLHLAK